MDEQEEGGILDELVEEALEEALVLVPEAAMAAAMWGYYAELLGVGFDDGQAFSLLRDYHRRTIDVGVNATE